MKERPVIIKLNQQCTVDRQGKYGWEPDTAHEPIYIAVAHIESFSFCGLTYLKMTSGERIQVTETPEEIMAMINQSVGVKSGDSAREVERV
ncbi:hypothetical protein [Serratia plymuthica]|uniref:hypothetical protein n=1 Tax=Serratia plymuthica TaxID=82996 RepID=UPI00141A4BFE|nr:hypothetical protein [Serratia plymuthica]NIC28253.1 hypothetical protein [Serratia plymuthica]